MRTLIELLSLGLTGIHDSYRSKKILHIKLRKFWKNNITWLRPNHIVWIGLMIFYPFSDVLEVLALVLSIEVHPGAHVFHPPLTKYTSIRCTHKLLPKDIKTVTCPNRVN